MNRKCYVLKDKKEKKKDLDKTQNQTQKEERRIESVTLG